jgi:hypothetical protein
LTTAGWIDSTRQRSDGLFAKANRVKFPFLSKLDDLLGNHLGYWVVPINEPKLPQGVFERADKDSNFVWSERLILQQRINRHHNCSDSLRDIHRKREPASFPASPSNAMPPPGAPQTSGWLCRREEHRQAVNNKCNLSWSSRNSQWDRCVHIVCHIIPDLRRVELAKAGRGSPGRRRPIAKSKRRSGKRLRPTVNYNKICPARCLGF